MQNEVMYSIPLTNEEIKALGFKLNKRNKNLFYANVNLHSGIDLVIKKIIINYKSKTHILSLQLLYSDEQLDEVYKGEIRYLEELEDLLIYNGLFNDTEEQIWIQIGENKDVIDKLAS